MPVRNLKVDPLTATEINRLGTFLKSCKGGRAMGIEQLDGFFAALIAGPELVMPREYYPEVFGGEMTDACEFDSIGEANEVLGLLARHWNTIAGTLYKGEVYLPRLMEDEDGVARGNDWADGFMRGMGMRHNGWGQLINDDDHGNCILPVLTLYHEHDKDPKMRPKPIGPEQREKIIVHMAAGIVLAYQYFQSHDQTHADATFSREPRCAGPKIGRNDPCPCGSGRKYKKCCGGATVN